MKRLPKQYVVVCIILIMAAISFAACSRSSNPAPIVGLQEASETEKLNWNSAANVSQTGNGNAVRVVTGEGLHAASALEMAAGSNGRIAYGLQVAAGSDAEVKFRMQFLSTQGLGQFVITALDTAGKPVGTVGWVITGDIPADSSGTKWHDIRYHVNYKGDWLSGTYNLADIFAREMPNVPLHSIAKYNVSIITGNGQHVFITELSQTRNIAKALKMYPEAVNYSSILGQTVNIGTDVENISGHELNNIKIELCEPYANGLLSIGKKDQTIEKILPGEKKHITWQVKAQRPDAVNGNKPWRLTFSANGSLIAGDVAVAVADNRPGQIYYVMTEDLEPIDSAGYPKAWGNADGWLEPHELKVQMVGKSEKLNQIANTYGAKWTHYIAWPAVRAAAWAGAVSSNPEWEETINSIRTSVAEQSKQGHEYGLHMHTDYDPDLPGNLLSYNSQVNGFWANHLRHGWAHSVFGEGSFEDTTSRTGILYTYQRILDELAKESPNGQILTTRAGSFDFGSGKEDEAKSTKAYRNIGLWGSSDADGNAGGTTADDYGKEIYLANQDDINTPASDLTKVGIVEFKPTPKDWIGYDGQPANELNSKADRGIAYFTQNGVIKPGIHAIIGFTHAMFVMGSGNWESLDGGQFQAIDDHLQYLSTNYVSKGLLMFGSATELVKAYLDYNTPVPVAVYGPIKNNGYFYTEYKINILGKDIPIDADHKHNISVKYPLYFRDNAYKIAVCKNGQPIYSTWGLPTPTNDIGFIIDDSSAEYTLQVYHNPIVLTLTTKLIKLKKTMKENIAKYLTYSTTK